VIHGKIEAPIPLMLRGVPKESALTGAKGELMRSGSRESGSGCTRRSEGGHRREWCQREHSEVWGLRSP
jgi:hypothetical protein